MFKRLVTTNRQGQAELVEHKGVCPVMLDCGVCSCLDLVYKNQLSQKTVKLKTSFQEVGEPFVHVPVKDCVEAPEHLAWCFSVVLDIEGSKDPRGRRWTDIGYVRQGRVVDIARCPIQASVVNDIVAWIRTGIRVHDISVYSPRNKTGLLKQVIIQSSALTKQSLVTFVVTKKDLPSLRLLARDIAEKQMSVVGVSYQIKTAGKNAEPPVLIVGKDEIEEKYGDFIFKFSSSMKMPANPKMSWRIWSEIEKICDLSRKEKVLCLETRNEFSALQHLLARSAKEVFFDLKSALEKKAMDVAVLQQSKAKHSESDLQAIVSLSPEKIIIFSIDENVNFDDLTFFIGHGYKFIFAEPYDSRPGSDSLSTVCYLIRKAD